MNIARDKKLHIIVGFLIAGTGAVMGYAEIGFILSVWAGLVKEFYDWLHPETHTADVLDFVATALGGSVAYLLWVIFS